MLKEEKDAIIKEYATHEGDTGSPEVQVAILTKRINDLIRAFEGPHEGPSQPSRPAENGW